jgi:hypothetical protein
MAEITIGFEGQRRDVDDLLFGLFDGSLSKGQSKKAPGNVTIVVKSMPMAKGTFAHAVVEVAVFVGTNVALPLFLTWLYDRWKAKGERPVSLRIENRFYQIDPAILQKAIEDEIKKLEKKDPED